MEHDIIKRNVRVNVNVKIIVPKYFEILTFHGISISQHGVYTICIYVKIIINIENTSVYRGPNTKV